MFGSKVYELPLGRDYVSRWGVVEAVRELLQNAIDSPAPFEVEQKGDTMTITSQGVRLDAATLVLGRSSKANDDAAIGQFGEGYKLAMLVLTREEKWVVVVNGDNCWRPEFRRSSQFNIDTLHITEHRLDPKERVDGVRFVISGLDADEQAAIKASCLLMQDALPDTITTPYGEILPSRPRQLYVGGLFVCETELNYGYNFNPGQIELERDRQTVANFDLRWKTKDAWLSTQKFDHIADMIEQDMPDVNCVQFNAPVMVKEACYRKFIAAHDGAVIANSQEELDELVERGMTVVVTTSDSYYKCVTESESYKKSPDFIPKQTPQEALAEWYNNNKKYMSRLPAASFKLLLQRSEKWRNK